MAHSLIQLIRRLLILSVACIAANSWSMGALRAGIDLENIRVFENVQLTDTEGRTVTLSRENMGHADMRTVGFTGERVELKIGSSSVHFKVPNRIRTTMSLTAGPEAFERIALNTPCSGQSVGLEVHKIRPSTYQLSLLTARGTVALAAEFRVPMAIYRGHEVVSFKYEKPTQ